MDLAKYGNITAQELFKQKCIADYGWQTIEDFLSMFYLLHPTGSTFDNWEDVPFYEYGLFPMVMLFVLLEQLIRVYQGRNLIRFADMITNIGAGLFFLFARALTLSVVIHVYMFLYNHYRIIDLPLHSVFTWFISLLFVEFVYYWTHRALHEFNFFWGAHAFHHMDEDVNITTSIRDSVIDLVLYDITPIPLAVIVPPQLLIVHMQFSLIYQIWLHNSVIGNLGIIEYIVNTPAQHRVHHGKNPYCIDTNYGALLMIFDRMFGTYRRERSNDPIVFGIVSPIPRTFNWLTLQWGYYGDVAAKYHKMDSTSDKMGAIFKGPGWEPGKPRLGLISDVPEPDRSLPKFSYNPFIPVWKHFYVMLHFGIVFSALYFIGHHSLIIFSFGKAFIAGLFIIATFTSFGLIYDNTLNAPLFELIRLMFYTVVDYYLIINTPWEMLSGDRMAYNIIVTIVRALYFASAIFWFAHIVLICFLDKTDSKSDDIELESPVKKNGEILNEGIADSEKQILPEKKRANGDVPEEYFSLRLSPMFNVGALIVGFFFLFSLKLFKVESCRASLNLLFEP